MRVINIALMRHPENWLTVLLMVIIASFAFQAGINFVFKHSDK